MGQTTDQIESHIETQREGLQANLRELEDKVKSATDWRQQFQKHPGIMVAAAFGVGVLLCAIVRKSPRRDGYAPLPVSALAASNGQFHPGARRAAPEPWHSIRVALIGIAMAKIQSVLGGALRRFSERQPDTIAAEPEPPAPSTPSFPCT
jgi:hypothetical protein